MVLSASPRTLVPALAVFIVTLLLWNAVTTPETSSTIFRIMSPSSHQQTSMASSSSAQGFDPSTALAVDISQIPDSSPPRLKLSVKNTYDKPVTFLRWETPLDPMALQLGVLSLTPEKGGEPIRLATIAVRRMMPPKADQFITIQPGESAANEVTLRAPVVPEDSGLTAGKVAEVEAKGSWAYAWALDHDTVVNELREKIGGADDAGASRGKFSSKEQVTF